MYQREKRGWNSRHVEDGVSVSVMLMRRTDDDEERKEKE